jgi:putative ABC transport system permease protein
VREIRIPGIRRVLRVSWSVSAVGREIDDEIRFHLEARTEELMNLGLSERDARERAYAAYGDIDESRRELTRLDRRRVGAQHREEMLMSFADDLRYAARSLSRRPALLLVTTTTLSLGIAANAVMFGVVDQLLLRPPAHVVAPDAVKRIYYRDMEGDRANIGSVTTYPVLTALRANAAAFSELAAYGFPSQYSLGRGRDAQNVSVQLVSGNYFHLLGVRAFLGRALLDDDDRFPDGNPVAVVSYGLWQQQLGGEVNAIGRTLLLQGKTFTVVGVAPRGFAGIDRDKIDIWLPISAFGNEALGEGWYDTTNNWWAQIIGRVRGDVTSDVAAAQATATYRGLVREWKQAFRDSTSSVVLSSIIPTRTPNGLSREAKVSLWLMGVSGIVLLIACANVANLLIARTLERRREIAVRIALGVSRGRLVRMLLTEAALLAFLGSVAALGIAYAASHLVQHILLPNIVWSESVLDARVFAFTLGIAIVCMLLAGLAPALQGMSTKVAEGLKVSSRQVAGGRGRLRFALVLAQAALSVMLLIGAGLTVRSLRNIVSRDVGIDRDRVLRVTMPLTRFGFDTVQIEDIYRRGAERVRAIPGVTGVAVARLTVPMGSASATAFSVPGIKRIALPGSGPYNSAVTRGFFATVGATLIRGRDFTAAEESSPARVVIINEAIANAYWPNESALGKCVKYGGDSLCSEVIGVVRNVLQFSVIRDDRAIVYAPPHHPGVGRALPGAMLVRVASDPAAIIPIVRKELQALAPTMPFVQVKPYTELLAPQLQPWRLAATMFTLFGVIALVIAAVGLYSVMAYWVSQRTQEIGVRMALGASRSDVVRLVAVQSSRAVVAGLIVGGIAAYLASRWIADMLYETSPHDPVVYSAAALVLALAAAVASIVPARRSTAVDPSQAIRAE